MNARWLITALLLFPVAGCTAEVGQACDGFFSNGCNAPASCVEGPKGSYCANSCDTRMATDPGPMHYCKDPAFHAVEVMVEAPNGPAPMGCMCMPKAAQ